MIGADTGNVVRRTPSIADDSSSRGIGEARFFRSPTPRRHRTHYGRSRSLRDFEAAVASRDQGMDDLEAEALGLPQSKPSGKPGPSSGTSKGSPALFPESDESYRPPREGAHA